MAQKRHLLLLVAALTIALSGEHVAAQKAPPAAGSLKILDFGTTTTPIYGFEFSATATVDLSGGGSAGKSSFNAIGVTRTYDAVSVDLIEAIATGHRLKHVEIAVFRPGSNTVEATYGLSDVVVTSLSSQPGAESVGFSYRQITFTSGGKSYCFDVTTNAGC